MGTDAAGPEADQGRISKRTGSVLSETAQTLSEDQSWIEDNNVLSVLKQADYLSLSDLSVKSQPSLSPTLEIDGLEYEVRVELIPAANGIGERFGIAVEPGFVTEANNLRIYRSDGTVADVPLVEEKRPVLDDEALFIVTIEEIEDPEKTAADRLKMLEFLRDREGLPDPFADTEEADLEPGVNAVAGKVLTSTHYLTLHELELREDHDPWSNEEFELFLGSGTELSGTTSHKFNGSTRDDAANNSRTYPDINNTSTYSMSTDIALAILTSTSKILGAFENDNSAGKTEGKWSCSSYPCIDVRTMEYFMISNNTVTDVTNWDIEIQGYSGNNDDLLQNSGVVNITLDDVDDLLGGNSYFETDDATSGYLNDVNYTFGKLTE